MKFNDKVKVIKLHQKEAMNLWNGYDDLTGLLDQTGIVTTIINPDSGYEKYGIEFDDDYAHMTRVRTGYIFSADELEIIKVESENVNEDITFCQECGKELDATDEYHRTWGACNATCFGRFVGVGS